MYRNGNAANVWENLLIIYPSHHKSPPLVLFRCLRTPQGGTLRWPVGYSNAALLSLGKNVMLSA